MISEYTKIGSVRNGFLVVHQDKLPLAYKTLLTIAKNIEDDDNQTSEYKYTSYGKPSKYDPQYSQDPRERYDHGGSQSGH